MSPPCHLTNSVVSLWTLPFCSRARIYPTFRSVSSLPIESKPLSFFGWHLNGVGPLPPPAATTTTVRRQVPPVGRRARDTWTTTLDFVQKTLHLGAMLLATQDGRYEYVRDKRPGLQVPHSAGCHATPQRSPPKPHQPDLFAPRFASMLHICRPHAPRFSTSLREHPAQASVLPLFLFWCFRPAWNYAHGHAYWNQDPTGLKTLYNQ